MLAFTASLGRVAWAWAQDPSAAAVKVSALTGGITARAAFHHPGFFDAARRCMTAYSAASNPAQADARQKDCLAIWMRRNGADPQAIAFMRFAPVPAAISEVRNYGPVDVIHAAMLWADASDGWAIVGNPGDVLPLWNTPHLDADPEFARFVEQHPGAKLWSDSLTWPESVNAADGGRELSFNFAVKVCHACAVLGVAAVAYSFERSGAFIRLRMTKVAAKSPKPD